MSERSAEKDAPRPSAFDHDHRLTVTWNPEVGVLPLPIARLFARRGKTDGIPGHLTMLHDRGHATYYAEQAIPAYLRRYHSTRDDIEVALTPGPEDTGSERGSRG
jgi:hypothetical protein